MRKEIQYIGWAVKLKSLNDNLEEKGTPGVAKHDFVRPYLSCWWWLSGGSGGGNEGTRVMIYSIYVKPMWHTNFFCDRYDKFSCILILILGPGARAPHGNGRFRVAEPNGSASSSANSSSSGVANSPVDRSPKLTEP